MSLKYFEKIVEPAALKCTLGEHSFKNDNPNDVKLSKLILHFALASYTGVDKITKTLLVLRAKMFEMTKPNIMQVIILK